MGRRVLSAPAEQLAASLLGCLLVRVLPNGVRTSGRIVETEAYVGPEDRASHAFGGRRTDRNASMYLPGGHAYVYFTYGMHFCMNIVSGNRDDGQAVLVRALEPIEGIEEMAARRTRQNENERDLCSGPAKLCQALGIDRALDGEDLTRSAQIWLERRKLRTGEEIVRGSRVGLGNCGEWKTAMLRFGIDPCRYLSKPIRSRSADAGL